MTPLEGFDVPLAHPTECPQHSVRIPSIKYATLTNVPGGIRTPNNGSEDRCDIHFTTGTELVLQGHVSTYIIFYNILKQKRRLMESNHENAFRLC